YLLDVARHLYMSLTSRTQIAALNVPSIMDILVIILLHCHYWSSLNFASASGRSVFQIISLYGYLFRRAKQTDCTTCGSSFHINAFSLRVRLGLTITKARRAFSSICSYSFVRRLACRSKYLRNS